MSIIPNNASIINQNCYYYSNGSYERKNATFLEENSTVAKTANFPRSIHGPIPREELRKLVEHIDLDSPDWEKEIKEALANQQFVVDGINSESEQQPNQIGMTKQSYIQSYCNWTTASTTAMLLTTFFTPAIIKKYLPGVSEALRLPSYQENQNIVSYSGMVWKNSINHLSTQLTEAVPAYISAPALSYIGYKGLEALITSVVQYPATDYRTWTALNLQKYLEQVYPKLIPEQYQKDSVFCKITSPDGRPIRSPFYIDKPEEMGRLYEEHVLKNILNNQQKLNGKLVCPADGKTEIELGNMKRDNALSDRIELRLLLLDTHRFKE